MLPRDAVGRLLVACEGTRSRDLRDTAIILLLRDTGLRLKELARLRLEDLDLPGGTATIRGNGDARRTVAFTPETARAITRYVGIGRAGHARADAPAVWLGHGGPMTGRAIDEALQARATSAGLGPIRPRDLAAAADLAALEVWVTAELDLVREATDARIEAERAERTEELGRRTETVETGLQAIRDRLAEVEGAMQAVTARLAEVVAPAAPEAEAPDATGEEAPEAPEVSDTPEVSESPAVATPETGDTTTRVVTTGLPSLESVSRFQRQLGRLAGVREVGVAAGGDGTHRFVVVHDPAIALRDLVPAMRGFDARVVESGEGFVGVSARDRER